MREILFRGKRADNGEWVYGDLLSLTDADGRRDAWEIKTAEKRYAVTPKTIGQFIDQLDEYAVRIFEGDIIELEDGGYYIVGWFEDASQYVLNGENEALVFDHIGCCFTVVGNIFDNPELADW